MSFRPPRSLAPRPQDLALDALQHEVVQEKASTLGRLTHSFEAALTALFRFDAEAAPAPVPQAWVEQRERLVEAAAEALWEFVVQREACGLRNTEAVLREYRVPAAVRLRMGVVRRS